jgi:phosphocarrier protein HPr
MLKKTYTVTSKDGIHARPASLLTKIATKYSDRLDIIYKDRQMTLKSIIGVLSLGIPSGAQFTLEIEGKNENIIVDEIETLLKEHQII